MGKVGDGHALHFAARIAQQTGQRLVGLQQTGVSIGDGHAYGGVVKNGAEAQFTRVPGREIWCAHSQNGHWAAA